MRDSEKRLSSVSFTRHGSVRTGGEGGTENEEDELHMCMAPHVQALLARDERRPSCCGLAVPVPFERAAPNTFFNPRFDSEILEGQYKSSSFPQIRLRFRYALLYIMVFALAWISYFLAFGLNGLAVNWPVLCTIFSGVFLLTLLILLVTFTDFYRVHMFSVSVIIALLLCALSLSLIGFFPYRTLKDVKFIGDISRDVNFIGDISQAGHFVMCVEVVLIIYTVIPLPLYLCIGLSLSYSAAFEVMNIYIHTKDSTLSYSGLIVRSLLQICIHIIGLHILLMTVVRMRGTFMKVGQSLLVRKQLEMEKLLKEKMIHSVMPPKVADWLMSETGMESENSLKRNNSLYPRNSNPGASELKSLFRPFNMHCMENVSILFADIVGFTKMSSNKTAEELVTILNDLFERFDDLCSLNNCEKISTLGDCYYCVSGCPEPRPDHAKSCVEMGLGMITAIKYFDEQRGEGVSMRVGVHTGTVLCGIVGTRRFKFDVWSNDVTLANRMESTGKPGRVHVSEETARFLTDYILEEGDDVFGHKTYFIEGRQPQISIDGNLSRCNTIHNSMPLKLIISPPKSGDSLSPTINTLSPCVNISLAPDDIPGQLGLSASLTPPVINPNRLSPNPFHLKMKASSLPSILDMENEEDKTNSAKQMSDESSKSPTSTGSYGKYTNKIKNWKVPKFLRKTDASNDSVKIEELSNVRTCEKEIISGDGHSVPSSNGYQQVPIVIESVETNLLKPSDANRCNRLTVEPYGQRFSNASAYENDILDIKSYISQSRSDVSPFARSSSYRSQYGRTSHCELAQAGRARSSTMSQLHDLPTVPLNSRPLNTEDQISLCPSVNSRKDSGIRSTSRRSSIQQQIYMVSQSALGASQDMQRRVSGYYTSSQSSLARPSLNLNSAYQQACHQKLRKQSDLQLIRCVQDNAKSRFSYFVKPPLSPITLFFKSADMENEYRNTAHRINEKEVECPPTLATSRFNTYLDVVISAVIFLIISASLFVLYEPSGIWIGLFSVFVLFQLLAIALCFHRHWVLSQSFLLKSSEYDEVAKPLEDLLYRLSDWYPWHLFGGIFLSLPVISVLVNFSCDNSAVKIASSDQSYYIYLLCISIVHFCNFTQINLWVKNCLLTLSALIFISVAVLYCPATTASAGICNRYEHAREISVQYNLLTAISSLQAHQYPLVQDKASVNISLPDNMTSLHYQNITPTATGPKSNAIIKMGESNLINSTVNYDNNTSPAPLFAKSASEIPWTSPKINHSSNCMYTGEIYLDILLLIILVWFLNREFEISYRMSFYGNIVANKDKIRVQSMRNQADWLLHNIIPRHVAEQLKNTAKYSENHKNVGILFASIVNFNEMYDESYLGGKEYLRVLNELIGDFDELLEHPKFRTVDKIKTIGSTFMAASGLNPQIRQESPDPHAHLYSLMDFAIAMQKVIYDFNQDLLEFNLILRVGYNFGDVTAGVIGTTKLYYDIWGDAVNIASRMDSTGVNGRIQIGEACLGALDNAYEFEPRGSVYVKGKDNMNVFLLSRKRTVEDAL